MHPFHLRPSSPLTCYNHVLSFSLQPSLGYFVECMQLHPTTVHLNYHMTVVKSVYPCASVSSPTRLHQPGALYFKVDDRETSGVEKHLQAECDSESGKMQAANGEVRLDGCLQSADSPIQQKRRRRKKHGNKGRIPWNKGIKHTPETRALIKERTLDALRDPQVRKKMAESTRTHSEENKEKIRVSLRRLWDKRLKWKRLREKFLLSWAESIAKAAKKGGSNQGELEWDSYDQIREEIVLPRRRRAMEKSEKRVRLVQVRRETEAKENADPKRNGKSKSGARKNALHAKLTKITKKKIVNRLVPRLRESLTSSGTAWQRLEMELTKREEVQDQISLADQIQAAKNRRTESLAREAEGALSNTRVPVK